VRSPNRNPTYRAQRASSNWASEHTTMTSANRSTVLDPGPGPHLVHDPPEQPRPDETGPGGQRVHDEDDGERPPVHPHEPQRGPPYVRAFRDGQLTLGQ
jgi:hypothetical protein